MLIIKTICIGKTYSNFKKVTTPTVIQALAILILMQTGCNSFVGENDLNSSNTKLYFSLSPDGSQASIDNKSFSINEQVSLFSIERDLDYSFIGNPSVDWVLAGSVGTLTITPGGKEATFTATTAGSGSLRITKNKLSTVFSITVSSAEISSSNFQWDISVINEYAFDTKLIEILAGKALLKVVNVSHSTVDFNNGAHSGTLVDGNGNLSLRERADPLGLHVDTILPSQSGNLVGYWRMDQDWNDSSNNTNNGTAFGGASLSENARVGPQATKLNGSSNYIRIPDNSSLDLGEGSFFISAWIYPLSAGVKAQIMNNRGTGFGGSYRGFHFKIGDNAGKWNFYDTALDDSSGNYISCNGCGSSYAYGQWYHVAMSYNADVEYKLYVNGQLDATVAVGTIGSLSSLLPLVIGGAIADSGTEGTFSQFFDGSIDEIALWKGSFATDSEIYNLYIAQNLNYTELSVAWTPKWSHILGYWKMNGNWQDASINQIASIPNGNPVFSEDAQVGNQSGVFDGTGDYINLGQQASLNFVPNADDFSISVWFKVATGQSGSFISKGETTNRTYQIGITDDGSPNKVFANVGIAGGSAYTSTTAYDNNQWHHVVLVNYDDAGTQKFKVYIDSKLEIGPVVSGSFVDTGKDLLLGARRDTSNSDIGFPYTGSLDEVAIWDLELKQSDIISIYNRQKQKHAGHFDSEVIDLGVSGAWENFIPKTTIAFYKELLVSTESVVDYSLLYTTSSLTDGLIGYWPLNSNTNDLTVNANHGSLNGAILTENKLLGSNAVYFDGINDSILVPHDNSLTPTTAISMSFWLKLYRKSGITAILSKTQGGGYSLSLNNGGCPANSLSIDINVGGTYYFACHSLTEYSLGSWYHMVGTYDGETILLYKNGKQVSANTTPSGNINYTINNPLCFGAEPGATLCSDNRYFQGVMDEVAFWSRALDPTEIRQVFRRGANRIKYQVKSCVDLTCNCTAMTGTNSDDCDGDTTLNADDPTDSGIAQWLGYDGTAKTSFSEQQNCSTVDILTGLCNGTVNASSPDFDFSLFPLPDDPAKLDKRYFQYRISLEAEANTACSGDTVACMPELTSVEIGPTGRYYGGSAVIKSNTSVAYTDINDIDFTDTGCSVTYQLSFDDITYRYWNSSLTTWSIAAGENVSESSSGALTKGNITDFSALDGPGNLYWKAFLTSDTIQGCELSNILVTVTN